MASLWCEVTVDAIMATAARSLWMDRGVILTRNGGTELKVRRFYHTAHRVGQFKIKNNFWGKNIY